MAKTRFDVSSGIRKRVIIELLFLAIFEAAMIGLYFAPSSFFSKAETHFVQDAVQAAAIVIFRPIISDPRCCDGFITEPLFPDDNDVIVNNMTRNGVAPTPDVYKNCLPISKYLVELPVLALMLMVIASYKVRNNN